LQFTTLVVSIKKMAKAYDKKVRPRGILGRRYSVEKDLPLLDKDQSK